MKNEKLEAFYKIIVPILFGASIVFCIVFIGRCSTRNDLDTKSAILKTDSLMNSYLLKIPLDKNSYVNDFPTGKYFIWYIGSGAKYLAKGKYYSQPIIGYFGGSFGDGCSTDYMNKFYSKLKEKEIDFIFLIKVDDPEIENIQYNKMRITRKTPWGSTLDSKEVDVNNKGRRTDLLLNCYLIDLKSLKVVTVQGFECSKQTNGDHSVGAIGSDSKLTSKQIWYLIDHIEDDCIDN